MTKPKPIPPFKTLEEEAHFWDSHSIADDWDFKKMVKVAYKPEPKTEVIHVKVGKGLKNKIETVAQMRDISVSSLVRMWTTEKINQLTT